MAISDRLDTRTGVSATIDLDDAPVRDRLQQLKERGADLAPAMAAIADHLVTAAQLRFEAEAGPGGTKWPPFAPSTLRRMKKTRLAPKLLRDSGLLYTSLTTASDATSAAAGSNLAYARIHQLGGEIVIPERTGTAVYRYATEGAGSKIVDGKVVRYGSKLRFAKRNTKAKSRHERSFTVPEHTIPIPARPYLGFDADDATAIGAILSDHFLGESSA